jgi:hypothetical protein
MVTSMEAKYRHFPINHFHGGLQKVRGKIDGFTELIREPTLNECSYENVKSRGKLPLAIASVFKPRLMSFVRSVALLGKIPKTTLQLAIL